jgi:prolyl oligopeptidase
MSKPSRAHHVLALVAAIAGGTLLADALAEDLMAHDAQLDSYQWLEGVTDDKALDWVKQQNVKAEAELGSTPAFKQLEAAILDILDSDAKIPAVSKIGEYYYNFWKDAQHERGLWRRTTLSEYRKDKPNWETVIDLDALNKAEGENWVWHGADCLKPKYERCLVSLSRGGADADVTREFDLVAKRWTPGGFHRPEAKGGVQWIDQDNVYVFTDFGSSSMTESGYPRIVKHWKRGTPLGAATLVYEGRAEDMHVAATRDQAVGFQRDFVMRSLTFYTNELYLRGEGGALTKIDAPDSASKSVHHAWLTLELRKPWNVAGKSYAEGSLLVANFDDFMAGKRDLHVLFAPTPTTSLAGYSWTKNRLVLNILDNVKNKLKVLTPTPRGWHKSEFKAAPALGTLEVSAVDEDESDAVWLIATDFLTPTTLSLAEPGQNPEVLKRMPVFFDGSKHVSEQHFARSRDGTRIPYFLVRPKQLELDSRNPTLLHGYGGFEISMTPAYSGGVGKGWLEKGGVYAVANIRGGGEYGPRWHQAALREKRHKAYEDFAAVAKSLISSKITSPKHLGIQGGSNGGLLVGNMLTRYPELFGAIVVQVPLLDMQRYHKLLAGASWMAEYGDPDLPEEWNFIKTFSPYHLVKPDGAYPPTLFMTSTRDDRVHPGHARKMMAKMADYGHDVRYYENIEGGHGGAANNKQAAHMAALAYAFLAQKLSR